MGIACILVIGSLVREKTIKRGSFLSDRTSCISSHRNGISCSWRSCWTTTGNFCRSCSFRGLTYRCSGIACAHRSSDTLARGAGAGLALQHYRHGRPSECAPTFECGTRLRGGLVHTDISRAVAAGHSFHDLRTTAGAWRRVRLTCCVVSPTTLNRRNSTYIFLTKPSSPTQLVSRCPIQQQRWHP